MTNQNIDQNKKNEPIHTPGTEKSPEQLRLEKDKADHAAKNAPKSDEKGNTETEKKA
jgi:hypothetical protein